MVRVTVQVAGKEDARERSAELVMDGQSLLIAHGSIHSVKPVEDVRMESGDGQAIGTLALGGDTWPVFCLDGNLDILGSVPAARRTCVLLKSECGGVGFLCDEVRVIDNAAVTVIPVPGCMRAENSPMDSLAIIDGRIT